MMGRDFHPQVGEVYDLTFPVRPDYGVVRVEIVAADQPTATTPCGAETVPIRILSGRIERANPHRWIGPGEVTSIAVFIPRWTRVKGGGS